MRNLLFACIAFIVAAPFFAGCNTSGCTDNQNALPLAGFYSYSTGQAISISDFDIYGESMPGDSALYSTGVSYSEVYLPFRSTTDNVAYIFKYFLDSATTVSDRIAFTYTSEPYFASEECGAMYFYRIKTLTYTRNLIDSVAIVDSLITNADNQRIKIYFRTAQAN